MAWLPSTDQLSHMSDQYEQTMRARGVQCATELHVSLWEHIMGQVPDFKLENEIVKKRSMVKRDKLQMIGKKTHCGAWDCCCEKDPEKQIWIEYLRHDPETLAQLMKEYTEQQLPKYVDDGPDNLRRFLEANPNDDNRHLMKMFSMAPFLLGRAHQPFPWINYMYEEKLLPSPDLERTFQRSVVMADYDIHIAEIIDESMSHIQLQVIDSQHNLHEMSHLFEVVDQSVWSCSSTDMQNDQKGRPLEEILHEAKRFSFLHDWKNAMRAKQANLKSGAEHKLNDRQLALCVLFCARQFMQYTRTINELDEDPYVKWKKDRNDEEKRVEYKKKKGNECFKRENYEGAIKAYSQAITDSRYSAVLYGNRAQAFTHLGKYREALSDSLRSILLDPSWPKGYYRCAKAYRELNRNEYALRITDIGKKKCPFDKALNELQIQITRTLSRNPVEPHARYEEIKKSKTPKKEEPPSEMASMDVPLPPAMRRKRNEELLALTNTPRGAVNPDACECEILRAIPAQADPSLAHNSFLDELARTLARNCRCAPIGDASPPPTEAPRSNTKTELPIAPIVGNKLAGGELLTSGHAYDLTGAKIKVTFKDTNDKSDKPEIMLWKKTRPLAVALRIDNKELQIATSEAIPKVTSLVDNRVAIPDNISTQVNMTSSYKHQSLHAKYSKWISTKTSRVSKPEIARTNQHLEPQENFSYSVAELEEGKQCEKYLRHKNKIYQIENKYKNIKSKQIDVSIYNQGSVSLIDKKLKTKTIDNNQPKKQISDVDYKTKEKALLLIESVDSDSRNRMIENHHRDIMERQQAALNADHDYDFIVADSDDVPPLTSSDDDDEMEMIQKQKEQKQKMQKAQEEQEKKRKEMERKRKEMEAKRKEMEAKRKLEEDAKRKKADEACRALKKREQEAEKRREENKAKHEELERKKREDEKRRALEQEKQEKKDRRARLKNMSAEGSKALEEMRASQAYQHYDQALDMIKTYTITYFEKFTETDHVVLKFAIGLACVHINTTKDILLGVKWFNEILEKHKSFKVPLAYFGKARALRAQNKFDDALVPLNKGMMSVRKVGRFPVLTWPGTQKIIEETKAGMLERALKELIVTCKNPPPPDAICRYAKCFSHSVRIYISDPDFKGYVRIRCLAKCCIAYHLDCWRKLKRERISTHDKDYLDVICLTTDCQARICEVVIYDPSGILAKSYQAPKHEIAPSNTRTIRIKQKAENESKIRKKQERKQKRKDYKAEILRKLRAEEEAKSSSSALNIIDSLVNTPPNETAVAPPVLQMSPVMVLRKDNEDTEEAPMKSKKNKKREKAIKNTMHLDEFVGREPVFEDEFGVLHKLPPGMPVNANPYTNEMMYTLGDNGDTFSVPTNCPPPPFGGTNAWPSMKPAFDPADQVVQNLIAIFKGLLAEHGPMMPDDVVIQRLLDDFPPEAKSRIESTGGVKSFLIHSTEFCLKDGFVCLLKDVAKAADMAKKLKTPFSDKYNSARHNSAPVLPTDLIESSVGGFPNSLDLIAPSESSTGNNKPLSNGGDLFAGLNFNKKPSGNRLDQLDFIEGFDEPVTFYNPPPVTNILNLVPDTTQTTKPLSNGISNGKVKNGLHTLDDIDVVSDNSSRDELGESKSSQPSSAATGSKATTQDGLMKSMFGHRGSLSKGSDLEAQGNTPEDVNIKPIVSNSDIARLDDFDSYSRTSNDALEDISLPDSSISRNQGFIQELQKFSTEMSGQSNGNSQPSLQKVIPKLETISKFSSPSSSVHSCPVNKLGSKSNSLSNASFPLSEPRPNEASKSRLKEWIKSPSTTESKSSKEDITDSILTDGSKWNKKTIDIDSLGGGWSDDDDIDPTKPDLSLEQRNGDLDPSPCRSEPNISPNPLDIATGIRSLTPDVRNTHSPSPSSDVFGGNIKAKGLPTPTNNITEPFGSSRGVPGLYGAIGSRTESPLHGGSVSSRESSKPGTPALTPSHTPRPHTAEPLPVFPSAHDAEDTVVASTLNGGKFRSPNSAPELNRLPPPFGNSFGAKDVFTTNFLAPGSESTNQNTLFPNYSNTFNVSSNLIPNVWKNSNIDNIDDDSQPIEPLNGEDFDAAIEVDKLDDQFIKDKARDVFNEIKDKPAFGDNPNLLAQIEQDIRQDVERSKSSVGSLRSNTNRKNSSGYSKTSNKNGRLAVVDVETNTDPYDPHKAELVHSSNELHQTHHRLQDYMDKLAALKSTSSVEIRDLRTKLENTEQEAQGLRGRCKSAVDDKESEQRRWTQDKRQLNKELDTLRQHSRALKAAEGNVQAELQQAKNKTKVMSQELEDEKNSREQCMGELDKMRMVAGTNLARAQNSEVKFLKLQMSVGMQIIDSTLKDTEMRFMQYSQYIQGMVESNQNIPMNLRSMDEQLRANVKAIHELNEKYQRDHEEQIAAVLNGTILATLPELGLPKPPSAPQVPLMMNSRPMMPMHPMMNPMMPSPFMNPTPMPMQNGSSGTPPPPRPMHYPPGLVRPQAAATQQKGKTGFVRIMEQLTKVFPQANKTEIQKHIQDLRANRGGSLTGMTMSQIVHQVAEIMLQAQQAPKHRPMNGAGQANQWAAAAMNSGVTAEEGDELFAEESDPCIICFEELQPTSTSRLECGHRFHDNCIKQWFKEQTTCPNCRNHTLLPEEYPKLR